MNQLMTNHEQTVTSVQIAEWTDKEHKHVMRDIRNEIESLGELGQSIFGLSKYTVNTGLGERKYDCYVMKRNGVMQLALKYDATTRYKVIKRLEEMEQSMIPKTLPEALRLAADLAEKNVILQIESEKKDQIIGTLQPKASYYDLILQTSTAIPVTKIAKDYGMSGQKMNETLHELGVQYLMGNTWLLYQKYAAKGYTASKTHNFVHTNGEQGSNIRTCWTQKGRIFIYELLKEKLEIIPVVEIKEK